MLASPPTGSLPFFSILPRKMLLFLFFSCILGLISSTSSTSCYEECDRDHNILDRGGDTLDCYFAGLVPDGVYSCNQAWYNLSTEDRCHGEYADYCCGARLADDSNDCLSNDAYVSFYKCYIECESDCSFSASTCDSFSGSGYEDGYEYDSAEYGRALESKSDNNGISTMSSIVIGICVFYFLLIVCVCYLRKKQNTKEDDEIEISMSSVPPVPPGPSGPSGPRSVNFDIRNIQTVLPVFPPRFSCT